ncbi:MAG: hypothetical protein E6G92_00205 [Alphaproteobacteria bacterium]|nr:MAG: hypothetical protein E6G92_00205 [Alphaproteobacteria bacterium]
MDQRAETDLGAEVHSCDYSQLASLAVFKLENRDFESFRSAARQASELEFRIWSQMVQLYDPRNSDGFADLIEFFSRQFSDKRDAAAVFGVALSTFYRWKNGDTIPHALVRATVRDTIKSYLSERSFPLIEPEAQRGDQKAFSNRRSTH